MAQWDFGRDYFCSIPGLQFRITTPLFRNVFVFELLIACESYDWSEEKASPHRKQRQHGGPTKIISVVESAHRKKASGCFSFGNQSDQRLISDGPQFPVTRVPITPPPVTSYTVTTCLETVQVRTMPCCYGRQPGDNGFCMTKSGANCPLGHCRRRNTSCEAGEGTRLFCMGRNQWAGILDTWCLNTCLVGSVYVSSMCFCTTLPAT